MDPSYSLRKLAKEIKVNPSTLSDLISKSKPISDKTARSIAHALGLKGTQRDIFVLSALVYRSKNEKIRSAAEEKLKKILQKPQFHILEGQELEKVNSWIQFAIMELMTFSGFNQSAAWLAQKLSMTEEAVLEQLQNLVHLNWVKKTELGYTANFDYTESLNDISSESIKKYHRSVLQKALQSLDTQNVLQREFQSVLLGFNPKKTKEAKKFIRDFIDSFDLAFSNDPDKKQVFQLAVQFYPVSE